MASISEEEKLRRRNSVESVLGTNALEGLVANADTVALLGRYQEGEIELDRLLVALDAHAQKLVAADGQVVGAA